MTEPFKLSPDQRGVLRITICVNGVPWVESDKDRIAAQLATIPPDYVPTYDVDMSYLRGGTARVSTKPHAKDTSAAQKKRARQPRR